MLHFKIRRSALVDLLFFAGAALVSSGVLLWCPAAGIAVAGIFTLIASVLIDRGGDPS